jgi:integrase
MALHKRYGIYHCDFVVNGERYRQTLETRDWREATQRENDLKARAREGKLASGASAEFSRMCFVAAAKKYLAERSATVSRGRPDFILKDTIGQERSYYKALGEFLAAKKLNQITSDDVRQYQAHRLGQGKHPNSIAHEVKALLRLLKRARLAGRLEDVQVPIAKPEPRQMLTQAEKQRVFEAAASNPEWQNAYCAGLLTANASLRPVEIRRLRWEDLEPTERLVTVRRSKSDAGVRIVPLNDEAWSAVCALKKRADAAGTYAPEHFMLPRMVPVLDATKPMGKSGWRSAWRSLRKAAAKGDPERGIEPMPRLAKLRYYDLRHQCVTEMLEAGIPEGVIREVAGHVDPAMTAWYSHPRLAARRAAVEVLSAVKPGHFEGGYVTNHVTKALPGAVTAS